ncbi:MAG: type II secretion system secretin GspD [Chloroflexi bacterium]|nr:type II secretion system secretin GspD [Chloroflexota bacterium]
MRRNLFGILILMILLGIMLSSTWSQPASDKPSPSPRLIEENAARSLRNGKIMLNFEDIDIRVLSKIIAEITGKNILLDQKVQGKISIISSREVTPSEAWQIFLNALGSYGYTAVDKRGYVNIIPIAEGRPAITQVVTGEQARLKANYAVALVILKNADANTLQTTLKPMVTPGGALTAFPPANCILISDNAENVELLTNIITELDDKYKKNVLRIYHPQNVDVKLAFNALTTIFKDKTGVITMAPFEPTNSLLVMAPPGEFAQLEYALKTLEQEQSMAQRMKRTFRVLYLENASADETAKVLSEILTERKRIQDEILKASGAVPGAETQGNTSTIALSKITSDPSTNSLVLFVNDDEYDELRSLISMLDTTRRQVLVSAVIAEVSLKRLQELGARWQYNSKQGAAGFQGGLSIDAIYGLMASGNFVVGGISDASNEVTVGGQTLTYPDIFGVLAMLNTDSEFNVLSAPRLLTEDHKPANISVGSVVPFATGVKFDAVGQPVVTYDYKDVGLSLKLTPHVSQSKFVRLEVDQSIKDVTDYLKPNLGSIGYVVPILSQREIVTTVTIGDAQTVIIGGLISKKLVDTLKSVPFLSKIPLIGEIFKDSSKTNEKTTLFVFLTPHIIDSPQKLLDLTNKYREIIQQKLNAEYQIQEAIGPSSTVGTGTVQEPAPEATPTIVPAPTPTPGVIKIPKPDPDAVPEKIVIPKADNKTGDGK